MNAGALALGWLLLVAGQNPSEGWAINQRDLKIPVDIKAWRTENINHLLLFVSADRGASWQQHTAIKPKLAPHEQDQNVFIFRAPADGEYWCRVVVVDSKGGQEPRDVSKGPPDQKILIDTRPPTVQILSAQRLGDDVLVDWTVQEEYPEWAAFKLEYRRADDTLGTWSPAPVNPGPKGPGRFHVSTTGPLKVRLSLKDKAGNLGVSAETDVGGNGIITTNFPVQSAPTGSGQAEPSKEPPLLPPPPNPIGTEMKQPSEGAPAASSIGVPPPPQSIDALPAQDAKLEQSKAVASTDGPRQAAAPAATGGTASPIGPPGLAKAPHKVVNRKDVTVEYELAKVGPSGVGKVEVYLTKDDGQHWELYADDPDVKAEPTGPQKRRIPLPGEGVFGIWLVAKNRAGVGKTPPRSGDAPQLRVEVDLTPPVATLYEPVPDPSQRDTVVLRWTAADKHNERLDKSRLPAQPISLEYSADGKEWKSIAAGIANSGRHPWQVPNGLVQAYLRLRVRDLAGNEAVAVTSRPQLLDFVAPDVQGLRVVD
jgi:hypothetical protein